MNAVCLRCGESKSRFDHFCTACGHRPEGDGLLVAWLLSDGHLSPDQLRTASERIQAGEPVSPSSRQLERAKAALGRRGADDPGLHPRQLAALALVHVLLTPLPGYVAWWWWRHRRPRAARQALLLAVPVSLFFFVLVVRGW